MVRMMKDKEILTILSWIIHERNKLLKRIQFIPQLVGLDLEVFDHPVQHALDMCYNFYICESGENMMNDIIESSLAIACFLLVIAIVIGLIAIPTLIVQPYYDAWVLNKKIELLSKKNAGKNVRELIDQALV